MRKKYSLRSVKINEKSEQQTNTNGKRKKNSFKSVEMVEKLMQKCNFRGGQLQMRWLNDFYRRAMPMLL